MSLECTIIVIKATNFNLSTSELGFLTSLVNSSIKFLFSSLATFQDLALSGFSALKILLIANKNSFVQKI